MKCNRCGAELDDDTVFCYECGSFVMRRSEKMILEKTGKRKRNTSDFWLFFRIISWIIVIAAGIAAVIAGYHFVAKDRDRDSIYRTRAGVYSARVDEKELYDYSDRCQSSESDKSGKNIPKDTRIRLGFGLQTFI